MNDLDITKTQFLNMVLIEISYSVDFPCVHWQQFFLEATCAPKPTIGKSFTSTHATPINSITYIELFVQIQYPFCVAFSFGLMVLNASNLDGKVCIETNICFSSSCCTAFLDSANSIRCLRVHVMYSSETFYRHLTTATTHLSRDHQYTPSDLQITMWL